MPKGGVASGKDDTEREGDRNSSEFVAVAPGILKSSSPRPRERLGFRFEVLRLVVPGELRGEVCAEMFAEREGLPGGVQSFGGTGGGVELSSREKIVSLSPILGQGGLGGESCEGLLGEVHVQV